MSFAAINGARYIAQEAGKLLEFGFFHSNTFSPPSLMNTYFTTLVPILVSTVSERLISPTSDHKTHLVQPIINTR